jgi:hypothetical protein
LISKGPRPNRRTPDLAPCHSFATQAGSMLPDLAPVVERWECLPESVGARVVALVELIREKRSSRPAGLASGRSGTASELSSLGNALDTVQTPFYDRFHAQVFIGSCAASGDNHDLQSVSAKVRWGCPGGQARRGAPSQSPVSPPPGRGRERGQAPRRLGASSLSLGSSPFRTPFQAMPRTLSRSSTSAHRNAASDRRTDWSG